jgi:hypothetical protein
MLGVLIVVVALVSVYQKYLVHFYTAVTLSDQDEIANNFLSMYPSFNATVISTSIQPFQFPEEIKVLPDSFEYENPLFKLKTLSKIAVQPVYWC